MLRITSEARFNPRLLGPHRLTQPHVSRSAWPFGPVVGGTGDGRNLATGVSSPPALRPQTRLNPFLLTGGSRVFRQVPGWDGTAAPREAGQMCPEPLLTGLLPGSPAFE